MSITTIHSILIVLLLLGVGYLIYQKISENRVAVPEIKNGERFAILKEGESNLTIQRKGAEVIATDESGIEIPLTITRK